MQAERIFISQRGSSATFERKERNGKVALRTEETMEGIANYSALERLGDGRRVEIRAVRPDDRRGLLSAVASTTDQTFYRRFFGKRRSFSEDEIAYFLNIDFASHVALVAILLDEVNATVVGGARFIVVRPGTAELAFAVIDDYQGQGIGGFLMRHLASIARAGTIKELIADVLPENASMMKVFEKSGLKMRSTREDGVVHVTLDLI
jgi:RimJ/RimL family protein N-acetyltransferase